MMTSMEAEESQKVPAVVALTSVIWDATSVSPRCDFVPEMLHMTIKTIIICD